MKTYFLLFLAILSGPLMAADEDNSPLVVKLATEVQLLPVYISPIADNQSGFSKDYLKSIEKVLNFDLNHNGMTYVVDRSKSLDAIDQKAVFNSNEKLMGSLDAWQNANIYFVVKTEVKGKELSARLLLVNGHTVKSVDNIALTGDLNKDRGKIHQLADTIFKNLFGTEGIATTRFIYTSKTQDPSTKKWISDIYEADYDGANAHPLTRGEYCVTPSYIPPKAGMRSGSCVYVSYKIGQPKIYLTSLKTGEVKRFSLLKGNQFMPTINRQKDKIAFVCDVTGNPDLFIQDFDVEQGAIGKPRQIFATHRATQATPTFSPDGKKIAFVSNKDGAPRIYVIDIPAQGVSLKDIKATLISKTNRESTAPSWSPDGKKIAYCAMSKGNRQIWLYDFDTRTERQITQGKGNKENPTWAPNSLHLIFNSTDAGESNLYLINLNQPEAVKISSGFGEKHFPSWEQRL